MTIAGEAAPTEDTFGVRNPATGEIFAQAPECSNAVRPGSNTHPALAPQQPFGGFKWSGIGVENGPWGLAEFSEFQVMHRSKAGDGLSANTAMLLS